MSRYVEIIRQQFAVLRIHETWRMTAWESHEDHSRCSWIPEYSSPIHHTRVGNCGLVFGHRKRREVQRMTCEFVAADVDILSNMVDRQTSRYIVGLHQLHLGTRVC